MNEQRENRNEAAVDPQVAASYAKFADEVAPADLDRAVLRAASQAARSAARVCGPSGRARSTPATSAPRAPAMRRTESSRTSATARTLPPRHRPSKRRRETAARGLEAPRRGPHVYGVLVH